CRRIFRSAYVPRSRCKQYLPRLFDVSTALSSSHIAAIRGAKPSRIAYLWPGSHGTNCGRPEQSPRFSTNEVQQGKFRPWSLNRRIITTSPKAQGWYSHCLNYFVSRLERNDRVGTNSECLPAGSESLMSDKPKIRDDSER